MKTYGQKIWLWLRGFGRFNELDFKPGWSAKSPRWWLVYLFDYGACVILLAGAVEPVSTFAQRHRPAWLWDKILDVIETWDKHHGVQSGPALWGSEECERWVRWVVPMTWVALLWWW